VPPVLPRPHGPGYALEHGLPDRLEPLTGATGTSAGAGDPGARGYPRLLMDLDATADTARTSRAFQQFLDGTFR
jgi:hypothetical protein